MSFKIAKMANLNIGISQAIWALNPFLVSIIERVIYGVPFDPKKLFGMTALILCAIFVSLSEVFSSEESDDSSASASIIIDETSGEVVEKVPVWIAVLSSLAMPIVCSLFIIVIKFSSVLIPIKFKTS